MAKILVADDNSNVQKTVALALADLGIEVVAVNNGEAAVKKLPDVNPDLVLADIFMPVRNGYEVCEYVKKDSRFSQVPVVLLVGAFDPLDEREAQRVGADGILKKPFVPPDPLIAMVKTLLERTLSSRVVPAEVPKAVVAKPAVAKASRSGGVAVADDHNPTSAISDEPREEPLRPAPSRMSFEEGDGLVAFSQLLEAPELKASASRTGLAEIEDNEQILTSKRDESLGAPIFWKTESPQQETQASDTDAAEDESIEIPAVGWRVESESSAPREEAAPAIPEEPLVLVRDEKDEVSNPVSMIVETAPQLVQDPATQASLNVEASKAEDLAANPLEWMASVPPPPTEEPASLSADVFEGSPNVPEPTDQLEAKQLDTKEPATELAATEMPAVHVPPVVPVPEAEASASPEASFSIPEPAISAIPESVVLIAAQAPAGAVQSVEDTVRSVPKQGWTDLAAALPPQEVLSATEVAALVTPIDPASHEEPKAAEQGAVAPESWSPVSSVSSTPAPSGENVTSAVAKHDWADLVSDLKSRSGEANSEGSHSSTHAAPQASMEVAIQEIDAAETKAPQAIPEPVLAASKTSGGGTEDTARSLPKLDWADLAASIQPGTSESGVDASKASSSVQQNDSPSSTANGKFTTISALAAALERAASHQGNNAGSATPSASSEAASLTANPAASGTPDPALVEAVVQRVLDKMRPQVVDIITKEFLRPVVQALVHREITKR